jgi:signal transduction histidine kinase
MVDELPRAIVTASGLISLAIGLYVFLKGRRQTVNIIFFFISFFMAMWALGEAMTLTSTDLAAKTFWTRFQGVGEMPLIPTYLLLALYFPRAKGPLRERRKAAITIAALYAPWIIGLVLRYATGAVYSSYYLIEQGQGVNVVRTPFFWFLTALGFAEIITSIIIFLWERGRSTVKVERRGLLILALAPVPMLIANAVQNLELSSHVTTPQASLIFVAMLGYGILRYGLFIDIRSVTRNAVSHAVVIAGNLTIFTLLCGFYVYGLDLGFGVATYALFVLTGIPFMIAYHAELEWARQLTGRYVYGREFEEGRLLQELGRSIRTVSNLDELAETVVHKVRDSMDLSACALMVWGDGMYRVVGYSAYHRHPAGAFDQTVPERTHMLKWENAYTTFCESGVYSTYWRIGNRAVRNQFTLEFIDLGILRYYYGDGRVREMYWREDIEGDVISIPLDIHGERVGLLWFGGKLNGARFSLGEIDFMIALSTQLSISLLNSQLMQELVDKSARLQTLIQHTSSAQEEERIRIARELHDGLAPYFLDFIFKLEMLESQMAAYPAPAGSLQELKDKAREALRDLRQVIGDLRPSSLDVLGLEKSLSTYLERFAAENGLAVELTTSGDLNRLDSLTEVTIYRVAQEALSNIARHASAKKVRFMLRGDDGWVEMEVEDDGAGFIEREVRERITSGECLGIKGMRERAELMQGELVIDTRPGNGTKLSVSFRIPHIRRGGP